MSRYGADPLSDYIGPLREQDVAAMGLALGPNCDVKHRPNMKTHRHIEFPKSETVPERAEYIAHKCPVCGDVHLPSSGDTTVQ